MADQLKRARRDEELFERTTVQAGIIGVTGNGKSSLINALAGADLARVGVVETTGVASDISAHEFHGIVLIDLPGVGTKRWRTRDYFARLSRKSLAPGKYSLDPTAFDFFILVLANRVLDEDLKLYRLITRKLGKRCFLVRSKFDIDADNNRRTNRRSDRETHREIQADVWRNFPGVKRDRVFVVSAAEPARGDFEALEAAIRKSLPEVKAERFEAFAMAYSAAALKQKRAVAEKRAGRIALLSAGNAFNPIPGVDVMVDIGLLLKLSRELIAVYGLSDEQLKHNAIAIPLRNRTLKALRSLLTSDGALAILRRLGVDLEKKQVAKWLPYAGRAIAAALGYRLAASYARESIARCETQALELLKSIQASEV